MKDGQGGGGLAHRDEFLGPLQAVSQHPIDVTAGVTYLEDILRLDMGWRRHDGRGSPWTGSRENSVRAVLNRWG